jgi:hypothetical protein
MAKSQSFSPSIPEVPDQCHAAPRTVRPQNLPGALARCYPGVWLSAR